jgi:hypothetical protein
MDINDQLIASADRMAAAAELLERAVERVVQRQSAFAENAEANIGRVIATVEARRVGDLEEKLAAAELRIAELLARGLPAAPGSGRKTLPLSMTSLLAKQGIDVESIEAGAVDAALVSLSIEQRIAVKSQLMRAGLLG